MGFHIDMAVQFGEILKQLRAPRKITQQELADEASVSLNTIQRGEMSDECPWRRSTISDVLSSLAKLAARRGVPLSEQEQRVYIDSVGLAPIMAAMYSTPGEAVPTAPTSSATIDADEQIAHHWLHRLIDERGVRNVLTAIEGLAAAWSVDLPPKTPPRSDASHASWVLVHPEQIIDGHRLQVFEPVQPGRKPQTTPSRKDDRKRKRA